MLRVAGLLFSLLLDSTELFELLREFEPTERLRLSFSAKTGRDFDELNNLLNDSVFKIPVILAD
jgi:hypothetical protein